MKIFCIPVLILNIFQCVVCYSVFYYFQSKEFRNPIGVPVEVREDGDYVAKLKLESGINYGVVSSAVFNSSFKFNFKDAPLVLIDGERIFLDGGKSRFVKNLELDFRWIKKSKIMFRKIYYGYFSLHEDCECELTIKGHSSTWLSDYQLTLYPGVDESYFWLGGLLYYSMFLLIIYGWVYIIFRVLIGFKARLVGMRDKISSMF